MRDSGGDKSTSRGFFNVAGVSVHCLLNILVVEFYHIDSWAARFVTSIRCEYLSQLSPVITTVFAPCEQLGFL